MSTLTIASNTNWSALEDTSSSSLSISLAAKTLTVSAGKAWTSGMPLALTAVGTKLHTCLIATAGVTSYSGTTLQLTTNGYTSSATDIGYLPTMWGNFANQALSSSSVTVGSTGSKVFWTRPNLSLVAGDSIRAINRTTVTTYIEGTVATYNSATGNLVMTAASSSGSGTVTDWLIISAGTVSSWIIHPVHNDTISINNNVTLTIDQTNYGLPANVSAIGTGKINITNSSTSTPIIFRVSSRAHTTNYGRITVQQNATFKTRGNYIEIATGTGSALSYTFPSEWDEMSAPSLVEVETSSGSGVYERWPVVGSMFYSMGRYGHLYGGDIGKTPTNLVISKAGGGTGIGTLGTITGGTGYGGVLSTFGTITGGTGGTTGTYTNVALTVSSGTAGNGATANITVSGGSVVAIQIVNPGSGYSTTSVLSASSANIGSTTGFSVTVSAVLSSWTFSNVPLTGGTGSGATAHITVASGIVTAVQIVNSGTGYTTSDTLSASTTNIGAGASFSVPVSLIGTPTGTFKVSGGSGANGVITITAQSTSAIGRLGTLTAGSGYVNGTYTDIPLRATSGSGAGARATIVVSGGAVTTVTLTAGGSGYAASNPLTVINNTFLGGSGSGFQILVSTLANSASGAYFSGFSDTPSAYAAGDLLTIECGGSIKPVFYVAEVGDFSNTTPATNIVNSICETPSLTNATVYQAYHVYSCTGGSGSGAQFVLTSGPGTSKSIGSQYGYFIAGTGYAVDDIITVGDGGLQVRVVEIGNTLTPNATNKVCTWDAAGRTLRFGADPDSAAVPSGAKVRVPNICIDAIPTEAPLIRATSEADPTWYFESSTAIGTAFGANPLFCDYECLSGGTKSSNTYPNTRGFRGTYRNTHSAGAIVTQLPAGKTGTLASRAQFNTSTGGELDLDITMFGYWFQFSSSATRNLSATNVGWTGTIAAGTTTGPVTIDKFCNSSHPFQQYEHNWSISAIQNSFSLSNGVAAQVTGNDTTSSAYFIQISNCPSIAKFSNITAFTIREWTSGRRNIAFNNSFFANDTTAIPQYIVCVGGQYFLTTANTRLHHLSIGGNCCRTIVATSATGSFSYTQQSFTCLNAFQSTNLILHNIDFIAQPPKGDIFAADSGSANILLHTGNSSSGGVNGYVGSGAFCGINLTNRILNNSGLNAKVAYFHVANLRSPFTYVVNTTQTTNITQNVRTPIALTNQGGAQVAYTDTSTNFRSSSNNGVGHGSLDVCDFVTGYTPYWLTGGSMTPNLPDSTWFMNLIDAGLSPTTGRIAVGCGGPNSSQTQYVVTGSTNTYPDNGGRFFIGEANDIVELTNYYALRGITGFQSVNPVCLFTASTVSSVDGWYRFTISAAGSGYSGSTLYSVTGGSGVGGTFYINTTSGGGIVTGTMQSGIGYQVGDVLTVGSGGGTITLTAIKTIQVRMVPWGQDITSATYYDLTYANLQTAFAAMTNYDSDTGLKIQVKIANDSNTHDLFGCLNFIELFTTVDSAFNPPIGYTTVNLSGLQSDSRVAAYSGTTLLDLDTSTTTSTLSLQYPFDGSTSTADIKIKKYGYYNANYSQDYGKDTVSKTITQTLDSNITVSDSATVAAYTDLSASGRIYDYCQYYFTTASGDLLSQFCTKNGTADDFGSYDIVIDATAASVFDLTGSTITLKCASAISAPIITTGTISFVNGASSTTWYTSSAGTSVIVSAPNIISGSRYQLWNLTGGTEIANDVLSSSGLSYRTIWTSDISVRLRVTYQSGTTAKHELSASGILTSIGLTFLDSQSNETVYNSNAIDGSLITEFSGDYPNVQIDITDGDGATTVQRIYAWYHYIITTADGIRNFFGGMDALDSANYEINVDVLDLKLDNRNTAPVIISGGYLFRSDSSTVIASTSNSIQMDPLKAYLASGSTGATLAEIEASTVLAKESSVQVAIQNAELAAIK